MTDTVQAGASAPAAGPRCPEALYSPATDTLRRCVLDPREHGWRDWHEAEGGIQWRHSTDYDQEDPAWAPPF